MPALFEGLREGVPERGVTRLPVKQAGLALPDPSQTAPENCMASCVITGHLVAALRSQVEFRTSDHFCLPPGRSDGSEKTRTDSGGGGSDGRTGGGPGLACTSPATINKDRGMAYSAAVHSQWDGSGGGGGIAQRPLPTVWP